MKLKGEGEGGGGGGTRYFALANLTPYQYMGQESDEDPSGEHETLLKYSRKDHPSTTHHKNQ